MATVAVLVENSTTGISGDAPTGMDSITTTSDEESTGVETVVDVSMVNVGNTVAGVLVKAVVVGVITLALRLTRPDDAKMTC